MAEKDARKNKQGKVVPKPSAGIPVREWTNDQLRVYGYTRQGPQREELIRRVMREIAGLLESDSNNPTAYATVTP